MSLFSALFGSKKKGVPVKDLVVMTSIEKYRTISKIESSKKVIIVAWFERTKQELLEIMEQQAVLHEVLLAKEVRPHHATGNTIIFAEHYPIESEEQAFFETINIEEAIIYSALDEPLFMAFGGEKISSLMQKMGMATDEIIEHKMISSSIQNAQQKISKQVDYVQQAKSQEDWFKKNYFAR
ncbi:MAG: hypothetical protein V4638_10985 [Bacteroidota bacterium]